MHAGGILKLNTSLIGLSKLDSSNTSLDTLEKNIKKLTMDCKREKKDMIYKRRPIWAGLLTIRLVSNLFVQAVDFTCCKSSNNDTIYLDSQGKNVLNLYNIVYFMVGSPISYHEGLTAP